MNDPSLDELAMQYIRDKVKNGTFTLPEIFGYVNAQIISRRPIELELLGDMLTRSAQAPEEDYGKMHARLEYAASTTETLRENYLNAAKVVFTNTAKIEFEE